MDQYLAAIRIHPNYLEAAVKVGTVHLRRGRQDEAAQWFNRAVDINDRLLTAYVGLGVAQHEGGKVEDAMATLEMAANIEPNTTLLFSEMARLQLQSAVSRQADQYLTPLAAAQGEGGRTMANLLDVQVQRYREAIRRRPNYADLHYRLGLLLRQRGELDEAVASFREALDINPNYVSAVVKLGLALRQMGKHEEAIDVLRHTSEEKPESVELHYQLGLVFADRNNFSLAVEQFEAGLQKDARNIDLHANLALALENMGLLDRAAVSWDALAEMAPDTEEGRTLLDEAMGKHDD
jgi:tetratricopeptide (TPR) repeat protein